MRVSRFFVNQPLATGEHIQITDDRRHYVRTVLRLEVGDPLIVFNGQGGEYSARLLNIDRNHVTLHIIDHDTVNRESELQIDLGLAISRREAMDIAIQKATELGVKTIHPLICENTSVSLKAVTRRINHWREISYSACEQCGLNQPPNIEVAQHFAEWIPNANDLGLIANPQTKRSVHEVTVEAGQIAITVGPEGGFTSEEILQACGCGFIEVSLGPRILRTETAAITLISLVQSRWGDL